MKEKSVIARLSLMPNGDPHSRGEHVFMDQMEAVVQFTRSMNSMSFKISILLSRIQATFKMEHPHFNPKIFYSHRFAPLLHQQLPEPFEFKEYERISSKLHSWPLTILAQSCLETIESAKKHIQVCKKLNPGMNLVI
jgi:hypothetical protein